MPNSSSKITPLGIHNGTLRKPIPENLLGTAVLDQTGELEAGSYERLTLTHTACHFYTTSSPRNR